MRVSSLFWCIFFAICLECIIIFCIFALEKLKFNVLTPKTRKGTKIMYYSISYQINLFPKCVKTWQSCKKEGLTLDGICIYLLNLQRDVMQGCAVQHVTITKN